MPEVNGFKVPEHDDRSFFDKVKSSFAAVGEVGLEKTFLCWHVLSDPDTPRWAKTTIAGALAYFVMPIDAVPDVLPMIGYSDDIGVLSTALLAVGASIKTKHHALAKASVDGLLNRQSDSSGL